MISLGFWHAGNKLPVQEFQTPLFSHDKRVGETVSPGSEIKRELLVLPCLSGLGDEELVAIGREARFRRMTKNTIIFDEADLVKFIFIVKTGSIKLFKTSFEGRELIVKIIGPGEHFCWAPLYVDGKYPVSAMALDDSTLIVIPAEFFKKMLNSEVSKLGLKMIVGLCSKVKYLSSLVEDLTFKDVEQRIIMALLRLTEETPSEGNTVLLTFTHQELASMTGTVREVVSRTMSRLKKEGIITESTTKGFRIDKERLLKLFSNKYPSIDPYF